MNPGDVISDRYLLEERLGGGGMGQVWRARDQRLQRTVAIKLIAPQFANEPEFLVRFLREAQSIARISHPNVVSVLDFGEADEKPFLVMEHVPGKPLSEMTGTPMDADEAVGVIAQAADAAGAAHGGGIVHRDIKPANIVLTEDGRAKLVDFGIASLENVDRITATGTTIGSPHYISPEQASGGKATPRSDVYSLGVVLFELLTGARPFEGESVAAVAVAHVENQPPAPSTIVPGIAPHLEGVVLKCLAKRPEDRFGDGRALADALSGDADARTMLVPAAADAAGSTMVMPADDALAYEADPFAEEDDADSPWKAALMGLLVGLVVLAIAVGAYALLSGDEEPDAAVDDPTPAVEPSRAVEATTPDEAEPTSTAPAAPPETTPPADDDGGETPEEEDPEEPPDDGETPEEEDPEDPPVEGDVEVETEPNGQGPEGAGPPGQEKKAQKDK